MNQVLSTAEAGEKSNVCFGNKWLELNDFYTLPVTVSGVKNKSNLSLFV